MLENTSIENKKNHFLITLSTSSNAPVGFATIKINEKGFTIVPTRVYLKNGLAKLEIALAKGKHNYDKREVEKNKDINRNINKMLKEINKSIRGLI